RALDLRRRLGAGGFARAYPRPPYRFATRQRVRDESHRVVEELVLDERIDERRLRGVLIAEQLFRVVADFGDGAELLRGARSWRRDWGRHQLIIVSAPFSVRTASAFTAVIGDFTSAVAVPWILTITPLIVTPSGAIFTLLGPHFSSIDCMP